MATTARKTGARKAVRPASASTPAAAKTTGLGQLEIILAALALSSDGEATISWAAYGEALGRQAQIEGVNINAGAEGMVVTIQWSLEFLGSTEEDDLDDVSAFDDDVAADEGTQPGSFAPAAWSAPAISG